MKKCLCALSAICITITSFAQSDASTAGWKSQPVTIDGKLTEWTLPLRFYDADTRLFFDIANDSSNIYLCFQSRDEMTQTKMMHAGVKLTLNTKGKAKQEASISYPVSPKLATQNAANEGGKEPNQPAQNESASYNRYMYRTHFIQTHSVMQVEGFATAKGEIPLQNPSGITAALSWDTTSNLGYEIVIPQKEFFGTTYTSGSVSPAEITLSVEIHALPSSSLSDDKPSRGSHGKPGGGDIRRGQFTGGGYNAGTEGAPKEWGEGEKVMLNTKSSFKQKFVLSKGVM